MWVTSVTLTRRDEGPDDRGPIDAWPILLALARRIDKAADSGSSLAALARQLSETMTEALVGVVLEPDKVDELRARRDAKLRGA